MKQTLLVIFSFLLVVATTNAQRTLIDFETVDVFVYGESFGNGSGGFSVVANPDMNINTSDSVGQFVEATDGEAWAGFYFDVNNQSHVTFSAGQTQLCADVWMTSSADAATLTFKVERIDAGGTLVKDLEPAPVSVSTTNAWTTVCQDYAGTTFDGDSTNRLVFLFNIGSTPTSPLNHYIDNVTQPNATSTDQLFKGELVKIFPNPATHNIFFDTDGTARTILVSDMMGRTIDTYNEFTGNNIRVADYAPGTYVMTFIDEKTGQTASAKFVKK